MRLWTAQLSCRHELAELRELLELPELAELAEERAHAQRQHPESWRVTPGPSSPSHGQYGHPRQCAPLWRWRVSCGSRRPCPLVPESERCARPLQYCAQTPFFWHAAVKPVRQWADWPSCLCQVTPGVRRSASVNKSCGRKMLWRTFMHRRTQYSHCLCAAAAASACSCSIAAA